MSKMLSKMNLISVVQQLPSEDIETIQGYVEMIENENEELKKQFEELEESSANAINKQVSKGIDLINQQQEFIKYLEDEIEKQKSEIFEKTLIDKDQDLYIIRVKSPKLEEILQKYKEIIGVKDEKNND